MDVGRRDFIRGCLLCGLGFAAGPVFGERPSRRVKRYLAGLSASDLKEAAFWEPASGGKVRCLTCPNRCVRGEGEVTRCNTRVCRDGKLYTLTYGKPCVLNNDTIQKNPLYHVEPGAMAIGIATAGCNLRCSYCQNWDISQVGPWQTRNMEFSPEQVVESARKKGVRWLTFSYTEPTAYYEYALDTAKLAKKAGIRVAVVTAGMINAKPLARLMKYSDAYSVTLKGYSREFYQDVCGARLNDVWRTISTLAKSKRWLEVVTLIVPGLNDKEEGLRKIAGSLARLDKNIPLHFLRFSPAYKLKQLPPTPLKTLERAREIARKQGLKYVYIDLSGHSASHTYCPRCETLLIERVGFRMLKNTLRDRRCPKCRSMIAGMWG